MKESTDREKLRQEVIACAGAAFMEHGIRPVKMDDIAEGLAISKRTLYEMFENKEALLLAVSVHFHDEFRREMEAVEKQTDNVLDLILHSFLLEYRCVKHVNPRFYDDLRRYPLVEAYQRQVHDHNAGKALECLAKGVRQGLFRQDVNLRIFLLMQDAAFRFVFGTEACHGFPVSELYSSSFLVNIRGICTADGLRVLENFLAVNRIEFT
ncbi:MAG: TetR/AcrR family transcriptional regulator [Clostridium sp.]|nr:TetR/AcrR family transcriptional regulator [Clostridium sp.]